MNVPLKKRHNYGKLNGSVSSHNAPSAKRLQSSNSNSEDSEYEHQSSDMDDDDSTIIGPATSIRTKKRGHKRTKQYLNIGDKAVPADIHEIGDKPILVRSSSSVILSSSASEHDSSDNDDDETTSSSSDSDTTSQSSEKNENCEAHNICQPLTEPALNQHNADFEPMNSRERVDFWKISDEFSDIEDDFDDKKHFSKPIRSERIQRQLYNKPAPKASTSSRKSKKDDKSRKSDYKPLSSPKKSKESPEKTPSKVSPKIVQKVEETPDEMKPIQQLIVGPQKMVVIDHVDIAEPMPPQPLAKSLVKNSIVEIRSSNAFLSTIKFRVNYSQKSHCDGFKMPTTPNTSRDGCANCSKHSRYLNDSFSPALSSEMPVIATNNKEEFYKYLGIDTKPPSQEKVSPEPSPTSDNHRRSLRVFIQQRQNEFTRKDDKSPPQKSPKSPDTQNGLKRQSPKENGLIKTNIKQRRSYDGETSKSNKLMDETSTKETDMDCEVATGGASNRFGESSSTVATTNRTLRVQKRRVFLPSQMMLTEMFKRYKQCFKQGFAMRQHLHRQQNIKRIKKRPTNNSRDSTTDVQKPQTNGEKEITGEDLMNTFSPTSITHSNASTDSAIVVNSNINELRQSTITLSTATSLQWQKDQANHIDKSQIRNPLDPKHGTVLAILTHSVSPNNDDVVIVIQESLISYWYSTSKVLCMFGIARAWTKVAEIQRIQDDIELDALYQHRLIDLGEQFPVYVEMRAKESPPDEFRQCYLTFVYLNVYYVKLNNDAQPQMVMERVNLDTLKGFANSIYYTALRSSPCVLMTWTEHNVNNQTKCGIVKYTLKTPSLDNIEDIVDYSHLQHDIKTLYAVNDYHVVGCGDRTVSMWDHRNGNLLIDIEIELPTIGQNIGCYTVGDDVPDYMLLVQLTSIADVVFYAELKVMAVQTVNPYNWRTLQTHNIPNSYGKIRSLFNNDGMLTITFANGTMIFLNISSPHKLYIRNKSWPVEQTKPLPQLNGAVNTATKLSNETKDQLFTQCNGQIIDITNHLITTKSVWEYFINNSD